MAAKYPPDLVVLDLGLPGLDGLDVIQGMRGWTSAPIIVLCGRADSTDKVDALDAGADDYVTKPFGMEELLARMRRRRPSMGARGRRASPGPARPADRRPGRQAGAPAVRRTAAPWEGRGRSPHAYRMAPARGAAAQPRQAADQAAVAQRGMGARHAWTPQGTCVAVHDPAAPASWSRTRTRPRWLITEPAHWDTATSRGQTTSRELHPEACDWCRALGGWLSLSPRRRVFVVGSTLAVAAVAAAVGLKGAGAFGATRPAWRPG